MEIKLYIDETVVSGSMQDFLEKYISEKLKSELRTYAYEQEVKNRINKAVSDKLDELIEKQLEDKETIENDIRKALAAVFTRKINKLFKERESNVG